MRSSFCYSQGIVLIELDQVGLQMIKRFGFRNFGSFREGAEISFEYNRNTPSETSSGATVGTVLGIKGANGSGKTNILKALVFLYCFCSKRMTTTVDTPNGDAKVSIPLESFFDNDDVTEFYIEFIIDETTYFYELDLTRDGIVREEIRRKNKKEVVCLIREAHKVIECLKEFEELKHLKLKLDQPILSVLTDYEFHAPMDDLRLMRMNFLRVQFNVGADGYRGYDFDDYFKISELYYNDPAALTFAKYIIAGVDDGVVDIKIEESIDKSTGETYYFPMFVHDNGDYDYEIGLSHESMGTKSLYLNLYRYWLAISDGSLLILDEFDTHLHAMILPEIIELFTNKDINQSNAQLIITAHNTEIIDDLGRYRVFLVNKENNESYCYRLDEVSMLRNDRLISPLYNKGKIGGTPNNIKGLTSRLAESWREEE